MLPNCLALVFVSSPGCSSEEEIEESVRCLPRRMTNIGPVVAGAHRNSQRSFSTISADSEDFYHMPDEMDSGVSVLLDVVN